MASALDWPQMWQKPSCEELLAVLDGLERSPPTWSGDAAGPWPPPLAAGPSQGETTRYLASIVKSLLG